MFKAILTSDRASLRAFARAFIEEGNDPAALLCLDHFFSAPLKLRNRPLDEVHASLCLYLDYVDLLNKLRRSESLAEGSARRRLFGFRMLGTNRYLVPEHTPLYKKAVGGSLSGKKGANGYTVSYNELNRCITYVIQTRILKRTEVQNATCGSVLRSLPCLQLLTQGECTSPKGTCTFQHIRPDRLTVDWYYARLGIILLQLRILDLAQYDEMNVKKYVPAHFAKDVCGCSSTMKLLARGVILNTASSFFELRIVGKF